MTILGIYFRIITAFCTRTGIKIRKCQAATIVYSFKTRNNIGRVHALARLNNFKAIGADSYIFIYGVNTMRNNLGEKH